MNLHTVDLNLLVVFEAIYRERNITQAANTVCLSQSASSNALARLRRTFNDALFVRTSEGMTPTPYADELIAPVRQALALLHDSFTRHEVFDPKTSQRTFNLRLTDMGEMMFLPPIIEKLKLLAPHARINAVLVPLAGLQEGLEKGDIDIALGFIPGLKVGTNTQRLFSERYVCALRAGHPLAGGALTLAKLKRMDHVMIAPQGSGNDVVLQAYRKHGLAERCYVTVPHFVSVPNIIGNTDLVVTIPARLALAFARMAKITILPPPFPIPGFDIKQHWHKRFQKDPANAWLRDVIASVVK